MTEDVNEEVSSEVEEVEAPEVDAPDADAVEQPPAREWSQDEEAEARAFGWKPPEEWVGEKPAGYIDDPREWLDRLDRFTPFKKLREQQEERVRKLESTFQAQMERIQQREREEYERRLQQIQMAQRKAVSEADTEAWDRLEQAKANLRPPEPLDQPERQQDQIPPELREQKQWLNDPMLVDHGAKAIEIGYRTGELRPGASATEQVEYAEQKVKAYFPHLFHEPEKPKPAPKVDGGGLAPKQQKSGFNTLPKDARDAFFRQVERGIFEDTKEDREFFYNEYASG